MNIAEAAINSTVAPSTQSVNLQALELQSQPKPFATELGGFHLSYDPQNRQLFLVLRNSRTGQVLDQIPGFQTVSHRRNSTPAAPANLEELAPAASTSGPISTSQDGSAGPSNASGATSAPGAGAAPAVPRGVTVNIAS